MTFKYFPHTGDDIAGMLDAVGVNSLDDLYSEIPEELKLNRDYNLPKAMSEMEIRRYFGNLAGKNRQLVCFAGGGIYDHYTPSIVPRLAQRSEFLTSYTPYQAEISQGTLHYIFEYQSMMTELTGMDVSNASLYDGSTATAEAMMMAFNNNKKANTVVVSDTIDPKIYDVLTTYAHFHGVILEKLNIADFANRLEKGGVAGVIVQQPDYFGVVGDFTGLADLCHSHKALLIINSVAADLALLKTPAEWGADIAVGDVQSLGIAPSFGGPYAGYMCTTEKLMRKMPGRIVGQTRDSRGNRVFVLTLQAREQHIRRQKATSNICSNESLITLFVTIYMAVMGRQGLKDAAQMSVDAAHELCNRLCATGKVRLVYDKPFFNEFLVNIDNRDKFYDLAIEKGILPGIKVDSDKLLIAATEKRSPQEIEEYVRLVESL